MPNPWHIKLKECSKQYQAEKAGRDPRVVRRRAASTTRDARRAAARERTNPAPPPPPPPPAPVTPDRPPAPRRVVPERMNTGGAPTTLAPRRIIPTQVNTAPNTSAPRVVTQSIGAGSSRMDEDEDGGEMIFQRRPKKRGNQTLRDLAASGAHNRLQKKTKTSRFSGTEAQEKAIKKSDNLSKAEHKRLEAEITARKDRRQQRAQGDVFSDMEARARALDSRHKGIAF